MFRRYPGALLARAAGTKAARSVGTGAVIRSAQPTTTTSVPPGGDTSPLSTKMCLDNSGKMMSVEMALTRSAQRWKDNRPGTDTWQTVTTTCRIDIRSQLWELERLVPLNGEVPSNTSPQPSGLGPSNWLSAITSSFVPWASSTAHPPCPIEQGLALAFKGVRREGCDAETGYPVGIYQSPSFEASITELYEQVRGGSVVYQWEVGVQVALNMAMIYAHQEDYATGCHILEVCMDVFRDQDRAASGSLCALLLYLCKAGMGDLKGSLDVLRQLHCGFEVGGLAKPCEQIAWGSARPISVVGVDLQSYCSMALGRSLLDLDQPQEALSVLYDCTQKADPSHVGQYVALHIFLSRAQSRAGDPHSAVDTLNQAMRCSGPSLSFKLVAVAASENSPIHAHLATGVVRVGPVMLLSAEVELAYLYHTTPSIACHVHALELYNAASLRLSPLHEAGYYPPLSTSLIRQILLPIHELLIEVTVGAVMCGQVHNSVSDTIAVVTDLCHGLGSVGLQHCTVAVRCIAVQSYIALGDIDGASKELATIRQLISLDTPVRQLVGGGVRQYMDPSQVDGIDALFKHHFEGDLEGSIPLYLRALRGCLGPATKTALLDGRNGMPIDMQCLVLEGYANALQSNPTMENIIEAVTVLDRRLQLGAAMGDSSIRAQLVAIACLAEVNGLIASTSRLDECSDAAEIGVLVDNIIERALQELIHFHSVALRPTQKYEIIRKYASLAYAQARFGLAAKFLEAAISLHDAVPRDYVLCGFCYANMQEPSLTKASAMYNAAHALVAIRMECDRQLEEGGLEASGPLGSTIVYSDVGVLGECAKFAWHSLKDLATSEELFKKALSLGTLEDPERPLVMVEYANMRFGGYGDVSGAEELYLGARALMPSNTIVQLSYLEFLFSAMKITELLKQIKVALAMDLAPAQLDQLWLNVARAEQMVNPQDVAAVSATYYQHMTGSKLDVDTNSSVIPEGAMLEAIANSKAEAGPLAYARYLLDRTFALPFAMRCLDVIIERYPDSSEAVQLKDELVMRAYEGERVSQSDERQMDSHVLASMAEPSLTSAAAIVSHLLDQANIMARRYPDRPDEAERFYLQAVHIERADDLVLTARTHYAKWLINSDHLSPRMALAVIDDLFRGVGVVVADGESPAEASLRVLERTSSASYDAADAQSLADIHTCYASVLGSVAATLTPYKDGVGSVPSPAGSSHAELLTRIDRHFQAALALHEQGAVVHLEYGSYLMSQRHFEAGIYHTQRSLELDPTNASNLIHATTQLINYSISLINDRVQNGQDGSLKDAGKLKEVTDLTTRWIHASLVQCPCNVALIECISAYEEALGVYDQSRVAKAKATALTLRSMQASQEASLFAVRKGLLK